jgi:uncharacterized protein YjbI with pentapeptide repeats
MSNRESAQPVVAGARTAAARGLPADLIGADRRGHRLVRADLAGSDLTGACFDGANLRKAVLSGAHAGHASFRGARLGRADLRGAFLRGADLGSADLSGATLQDADLTGARLGGANLFGTDLRGADLTGADLRRVTLEAATLRGAVLCGADLGDSRMATAPARRRLGRRDPLAAGRKPARQRTTCRPRHPRATSGTSSSGHVDASLSGPLGRSPSTVVGRAGLRVPFEVARQPARTGTVVPR